MAQEILLDFDSTLTGLTAFDFGEMVYSNQVDLKVNYKDLPIIIVFPDHILRASSSFVEGFFKKIVEMYGYDCIDKQVIIKTKNDSLLKSLKENLV